MKKNPSPFAMKFLRTLLPASALILLFARDARAGLTFTVDIYRASHGQYFNFYTPINTNATAPAAPVGVYVINSPQWPTNGSTRTYEITASGFNPNPVSGQETGYGDYVSMMNQITNGTWKILFTNSTTTNLFTFTVSAPNMNSNLLPATIISYPADGSVNVPNQPTFIWQGPTNFPFNGSPYVANNDFSFYQPANIPATQTSWMIPTAIPSALNCAFRVNYLTNYAAPLFVATTPLSTNVSHQPISGWASASIIESGDSVSFTVQSPAGSGHTLIAHYAFDNTGYEGQDSSGNGNDINCSSSWGPVESFSTDAIAGGEALKFVGGSSITPCDQTFTVWTNTLAGSFSVSAWIKTTTVVGNDGDSLNDYTGQSVIYADNNNLGATPIGLTGSKVAFRTTDANNNDDTLHSTQSVTTGGYVHIVSTRNQATGEKKIYINGTLDSSDIASTASLSGAQYVSIGGELSSAYNGLVDDVQVYSGVLSANEVAYLHSNPGATATNVVGADFSSALNTTNLTWSSGGDLPWFTETATTLDGLAAQSGPITEAQTSYIQTTVPASGQLSFHWKVSSEDSYDFLTFYINGNQQDAISGEVDWNQETYTVNAGDTLRWAYSKDNGGDEGQDAGFLDEVTFSTAPVNTNTLPVITRNPFNQTNYPGYNVALLAAATSNPTATWQWFKASSGAISGATNALYIPANSGTAAVAGGYYAVASNVAGSANTTTAAVTFVNAPLPPDWSRAYASPFSNNFTGTNTYDINIASLLDSNGNFYVVGSITGTNIFGTNVLISANGAEETTFLKQTAAGTPVWGRSLTNNGNGSSFPRGLAAAPGNGFYAFGSFFGTNWLGTNRLVDTGGGSTYLVRFDTAGSNLWVRTITGTNFNFPTHHTLVSDPAGNVTLSVLISGYTSFGTTNLFATGQQGVLAQYDPNGNLRWVQTPSAWPDYLAYNSGRIYGAMGGSSTNFIGGITNLSDRRRVLFSINATSGAGIWLQPFSTSMDQSSPGGFGDNLALVTVSGTNVFLLGSAYGTNATFGPYSFNYPNIIGQFFARYDTNGNVQVASSFGSQFTWPWAALADASGNVYLGGDFDTYSVFGSDIIAAPFYSTVQSGATIDARIPGQSFIAKFDRNGNPLWARPAQSPSIFLNLRDITLVSDGVWGCGFFNPIGVFGANTIYGGQSPYHESGYLAKITDGVAVAVPLTLLNPLNSGANFQFSFLSQSGFTHSIQYRTNLAVGNWLTNSTVAGDGTLKTNSLPLSLFNGAKQGFIRVSTQ